MKKIIPTVSAWDDCPFGEIDESYPRNCGRYVDTNNDALCDLSQHEPEFISEMSPQDQQGKTYYLVPILLAVTILYVVTRTLRKKKKLSLKNYRNIWNTLLLITFLVSGILGILLIIKVDFGLTLPPSFDTLFWHVEAGIVMFVISIFHIAERWYFFKSMFKGQ